MYVQGLLSVFVEHPSMVMIHSEVVLLLNFTTQKCKPNLWLKAVLINELAVEPQDSVQSA